MNDVAPLVSIGMPVRNAERYLEESLASLLGQSFEDFELLISDNASTDRTESLCRSYASKDDRVRVVRNREDVGVVQNFNQVFRLSRGRYFKWAAADDVCGSDYLLRAVEVLERDPSVVLAWGRTIGIDEEGRPVSLPREVSDLNGPGSVNSPDPSVRWRRLLRNIGWVDGPFYGLMRADVLAETGLHGMHPSGDQLLVCAMALRGRLYEIPEPVFFTRVHHGKDSRTRTRRDRAVLFETDPRRRRRFRTLKLAWMYLGRMAVYVSLVRGARLSPRQRLACLGEIAYAGLRWLRRPGRSGY